MEKEKREKQRDVDLQEPGEAQTADAGPEEAKLREGEQPGAEAAAESPPPQEDQGKAAPAPQTDSDSDGDVFPFTVACLGASAGGLEALQAFFEQVREESGIAYVVVTHLDAKHATLLPKLIQNHASIPVREVEEGMPIAPDHVYIIPPNALMHLIDSHFRLQERDNIRPWLPIDAFLHSVAQMSRERGAAIILSGSGSDGARGLREVKAEMGLVLAQDPDSARFRSMPEAAIDTGLVDYVLLPSQMPAQLVRRVQQQGLRARHIVAPLDRESSEALHDILYLVRHHSGHDFSNYKTTTIIRRIERRMHVHQLETMRDYARYLQERPSEVGALFHEFLIGVTNFFRDRESFDILRERVFPELFDDKPEDYHIRIWTPGVATGEEAYSIAILLREYLEEKRRKTTVQIFATDINPRAIEKARQGLYPQGIAADVDKTRLERHFTKEDHHYRIRREIREMLVFAPQNLVHDPPFSKLDLVCCRNLLIYLDHTLQKRLLPLFHYSLRRDGILFLGSSESIGEFDYLYETIDTKWKIFRRREVSPGEKPILSLSTRQPRPKLETPEEAKHSKPDSVLADAQRRLLSLFAPPSVIVNERGDIFYIHGRTGKYLEPSAGEARMNVLHMAREGIKVRLPALLHNAVAHRKTAVLEGLSVKVNGGSELVNLTVQPLPDSGHSDGLYVVYFQEPPPSKCKTGKGTRHSSAYVEELEQELAGVRESLRSTIEELETSNEELRSVNEEYQSTNEELQSANEELETSREEMQSLNEELTTVNNELQEKIARLTKMHEDMKLFLDSLEIPTVFLDAKLNIQRFTRSASGVLNILAHDIGRPLRHLTSNIQYEKLMDDVEHVRDTRRALDRKVRASDGRWYLMRILPYRLSEDIREGVVLMFIDIDELIRTTAELRIARNQRDFAQSIVDTVRQPLLVLDEHFVVLSANQPFFRTFAAEEKETLGRGISEVGDGQWQAPALQDALRRVLDGEKKIEDVEIEHDFPRVGRKRFALNARLLADERQTGNILVAMEELPVAERSSEERG